jgi:hypothetical protein
LVCGETDIVKFWVKFDQNLLKKYKYIFGLSPARTVGLQKVFKVPLYVLEVPSSL